MLPTQPTCAADPSSPMNLWSGKAARMRPSINSSHLQAGEQQASSRQAGSVGGWVGGWEKTAAPQQRCKPRWTAGQPHPALPLVRLGHQVGVAWWA